MIQNVFPSNLWREVTHIKPLNNQVDLQQSKFSFEPFPPNSFPSENVNKQIYPDLLLYVLQINRKSSMSMCTLENDKVYTLMRMGSLYGPLH